MERERWMLLYRLSVDLSYNWPYGVYFSCACIVGVFLWAVVHDRPVTWACQRKNWGGDCPFRRLPSQPTMSQRLRSPRVRELLMAMEAELNRQTTSRVAVHVIDAKPLPIGSSSKDSEARWGRAAGGFAKGYKFYAVWGGAATPHVWELRSMNVQEQQMAKLMIPRLPAGGMLLGDAIYDSSKLYELAHEHGLQLIAPPCRQAKTKRKYRQSEYRRQAHEFLAHGGREWFHKQRTQIERRFGNCTSFGGGLAPLPSWVRTYSRVWLWLQAKLLINAVRILKRTG